MPWSMEDVDKHMKGLTDVQKELWVKVANEAMNRCMKDGGQDCEGMAVKEANGAMQKNLSFDDWFKSYAVTTFNIEGVEIFSAGRWNGDKYTVDDIEAMVKAFEHVGWQPPLKLGHNSEQEKGLYKDGQPALGWINRVYRQGEKLLADFKDLPQKVYEAIKRGNYKRVSAEIYWNYSTNGKTFPRVLRAVALLGADIPAVTNLEAIAGLYKEGNHEFKVYDTKEDKRMDTEKELQEAKAKLTNLTTEKEALEAKNKELEGAKATAETKLAEREAEVKAAGIKAFVDAQKKAGKVLPAFEKELTALLTSASEVKVYSYAADGKTVELSQRETIERIISTLPKIVEFKELAGDGGDDNKREDYTDKQSAGIEVDRRAKLYMDKNKGTKYEDAIKVVLSADPELKTVYIGGK